MTNIIQRRVIFAAVIMVMANGIAFVARPIAIGVISMSISAVCCAVMIINLKLLSNAQKLAPAGKSR